MLLLAGCGSGGGSNVTQVQPPTTVEPGGQTGSVVVTIVDGDAKAGAEGDSKTAAAYVFPTDGYVRLVVTNPSLIVNGHPYKLIVDGLKPVSGSIDGLEFPVGNGYIFEVITYGPDHVQPGNTVPVNRLIKYGKNSYNVTTNPSPPALIITINSISACINAIPTPAYSNAPLGITATSSPLPAPLYPSWKLFLSMSLPSMNNALHSTSGESSNHTADKAPVVLTEGTLYAQAEFYINRPYIDTTGTLAICDSQNTATCATRPPEDIHDWTFNCPNPDNTGLPTDRDVLLHLVGVSVPAGP